jgi:hypothetical protein
MLNIQRFFMGRLLLLPEVAPCTSDDGVLLLKVRMRAVEKPRIIDRSDRFPASQGVSLRHRSRTVAFSSQSGAMDQAAVGAVSACVGAGIAPAVRGRSSRDQRRRK